MPTVLTRADLYAMVWDRPMTTLAAEFGLSNVALQKICRKHEVPTPPRGYWAKKAYNKPVRVTPLPNLKTGSDYADRIVIHNGMSNAESPTVASARKRIHETPESVSEIPSAQRDALIEGTVTKLAKAKPDRTGIVTVEGRGTVRVVVRPESLKRAERVLNMLVHTARSRGIYLDARQGSAHFVAEGETVTVELVEVADRIEHVPTPAELQAMAKWEAKQEADRKRFGHSYDYGRPRIPKWEERYQGRLAVKLEEVRILRDSPWGPAMQRTYADSVRRNIETMGVSIIAQVVAIAITKRENREIAERRRIAAEEEARRRAEAERCAAIEKRRVLTLDELMAENERLHRLEQYVADFEASLAGLDVPPRVGRLATWVRERLTRMKADAASDALEERLTRGGLFNEDD